MSHPNPILAMCSKAIPIASALYWVAAAFFVLQTASAFASPDEDLENLRQKLIASSERQEEISARLQLLSGEIKALKQKSVRAANKLVAIDSKMLKTEERLYDIQQVEQQTLETLASQNKGLANTLSALLQLSRQPEGSVIGSPENLVNSLRTATLLKAAIASLKKDTDALSEQLETLATLRDQYLTEQDTFQQLKTSRLSEQEALDALLATKKSAQSSLTGLNKKESIAQKALSISARDLVALIDGLEKQKQDRLKEERHRIKQEIARLESFRQAEAQTKEEERQLARQDADKAITEKSASIPRPAPSRKTENSRIARPSDTKTAKLSTLEARRSFISAKGTLALPVGGRIISKYSAARDVEKKNGIVIETRENATVISPYDGQIAFAGPFRHYGLLLIIDHGEGYHTLLAGMGSIEGSVGQLLLAGEPVGQMKSSNNEKPTLYMELRVKGSPVNPIPWLAAGNRKVSG